MIRAYTVYVETADTRTDEDRIQLELARHLAVIFKNQFKGVECADHQ